MMWRLAPTPPASNLGSSSNGCPKVNQQKPRPSGRAHRGGSQDGRGERLVALGARVVDEHADRGPRTIVMPDPEGNEFCLH